MKKVTTVVEDEETENERSVAVSAIICFIIPYRETRPYLPYPSLVWCIRLH